MRNSVTMLVVALILICSFVYFNTKEKPNSNLQSSPTASPEESTSSAQPNLNYQGKILAGNSSPYLEFKKVDYEKALKENKIILLNFYANWCPICRAEAPEIEEGFKLINDEKVVGFRINFNDSETDEDEKKLARDFKVTYQHTKVILKEGKEISRSLEQWNRAKFKEELFKTLTN